MQLHPGKETDLWNLNKYIPLLITTFHLGSLLHGRLPQCPLFSAGGFAPHNVPQRNKHNLFFLTRSIQFLSRHWLRVQLCLCSQTTVLSIHFLAQLQRRLQPHALEPAQIWSRRQEQKYLDTEGSPCIPDRSTTNCYQNPEEEQVVKTPVQSLTIIPRKTAIEEKHPENSACMQEGGFAFYEQMCSEECLDGPFKQRVYPGWSIGFTPGGLRQAQG